MQDTKAMDRLGCAVHLSYKEWSIFGGKMLSDPVSSKTEEHHMDELCDAFVEIWSLQIDVA